MNERSTLDVQLVDSGGRPLLIGNVSIDVVLYCSGRERYRFDAGETDGQGHLTAPYSAFEKARKDNQAFALMDYNTKLEDCDQTVAVRVPNIDELRERLNAVRKWFPENEAVLAGRLTVTSNGRVEANEVKATVTDDAVTHVRLPVSVK